MPNVNDMIVTIDDVRQAGFCVRGARAWFNANGIEFNDFLRNGVPAATLLELGDEMASRVVAAKCEREHG